MRFKMARPHPMVWYTGVYAGSAALLKGAGVIVFIWLGRTTSVPEYAHFGLLYALQTGLMTLALSGLIESVIGRLKQLSTPEQRRALFGAAHLALSVMLAAAVLIVLGILLVSHKGQGFGPATITYVLISGVLLALAAFEAQLVRLREEHLSSLFFSFVMPFLGMIGSAVMFYLQRSVTAFFLGSAIGVSVALVIYLAVRPNAFPMRAGRSLARAVLFGTAPFIVIGFFGWVTGYGGNYVINAFFTSTQVAQYTFALTISSGAQLVASAMNQVWTPRFYRIVTEMPLPDVEQRNRTFYRWQAVTVGLAGAIIVAVFPLITKLVGGNIAVSYRGLALPIALLWAGYVVLSPWWHCYSYYLVHSEGKELLNIVLLTSALGLAVWAGLMWWLGPIGVYIGFLAQMTLRSVGISVSARRHWPLTLAWEGSVAGLALIAAGYAASVFLMNV